MNVDISRIPVTDERYPQHLREAPGCPRELFLLGSLPPAALPCIAVVGTRKATTDGMATARSIAHDIAQHNVIIVSGLALGIDAAAHEGALDAGGRTAAVLGNGLDTIYPAQHEQLARRILERGGCLLSEYPAGTPAFPSNFLARNRIVSGLALAVVIIEAPLRSGTLVTAKFALEQGREVFVLPGPSRHPNFAGSHRLIREGARLATCAAEILEDLGLVPPAEVAVTIQNIHGSLDLTDNQRTVLAVLSKSRTPRAADELIAAAGLPPETVAAVLTVLSLRGVIVESGRGFMLR